MKELKKIKQCVNWGLTRIDSGKSLRWVYIHGLHRSGTSYMLQKMMSRARRGYGDWMLGDFSIPMLNLLAREENRKMNAMRLWSDFRKNLLKNGHLGWGNQFDVVVKQATGDPDEILMLTELFKSQPSAIIFMFREPHGWWASTLKKFSGPEVEDMPSYYKKAFDLHSEIGGIPVPYDADLQVMTSKHSLFDGINFADFTPTVVDPIEAASSLDSFYELKKQELMACWAKLDPS